MALTGTVRRLTALEARAKRIVKTPDAGDGWTAEIAWRLLRIFNESAGGDRAAFIDDVVNVLGGTAEVAGWMADYAESLGRAAVAARADGVTFGDGDDFEARVCREAAIIGERLAAREVALDGAP